jgi:TolB-like protein/class 3 adenylate cyclase/Flp pilus assembly protein TadD
MGSGLRWWRKGTPAATPAVPPHAPDDHPGTTAGRGGNGSAAAVIDAMPPATMPSGTVTFLFTDIEGSTRLWESQHGAMQGALARHDDLLRAAITSHSGHVFKTGGDSFCAAFPSAVDAAAAALAAQQKLQHEPWPEEARISVRMALHSATIEPRGGDYFGPPLNRVARLMAIAHGGQVVLSDTTRQSCEVALPENASLVSLGTHKLKDLAQPEPVFQLAHPDVRRRFPPLKQVQETTDDETPSIAVLPFANMSRDEENEYFADGLSDELLNVLAKVRGVRVASRTSAFSFKGKDIDVPTIAQKLNVANVLEGSVRKSGNRVRINAQLVQVMTDSHLWSETYDRQLDDIFAVQDDIAHSVVKELRRALRLDVEPAAEAAKVVAEVAAASKGRSENAEAYQFYLQARYHREQLTKDGTAKAIQFYLQSINVDPSYALAWAGLSRAYADQAGQNWVPFIDGFGRAKAAALRAIELEPMLAEAHAALGWVQRAFDWDWKGAETSFNRALELAPGSALVMNAAANMLGTLGKLGEAIELTRKATASDPLNVPLHRNLALYALAAGDWDEAERALTKVLDMSQQGGLTWCWLGYVAFAHGRYEQALELMQKEVTEIFRLVGLAVVHHALDNFNEYEAALHELIEKHGKDSPYQVAEVHASCHDYADAVEWLERAYAERDPGLAYLRMDPFMRDMYGHPRWEQFLVKMQLK